MSKKSPRIFGIWKVQLPISTTEEIPQALIYMEDHEHLHQIPAYSVASMFQKGQMKIYVIGTYDPRTNRLSVKRKLPYQGW